VGVEAQRVDSVRAARAIFGEPTDLSERTVQLVGEWRF
jgi:hypothetical protein